MLSINNENVHLNYEENIDDKKKKKDKKKIM